MKTKIIHLTNSNVKSNYLLSIGRLYDNEKYDLSIGTFDPVGELHMSLTQIGTPTFSFHIKNQRLGFLAIPRIYKHLKKNRIDILHVHTFWVSLFGLIAGKIAGVKVVMTRHHADHHHRAQKKIHILIDRLTAKYVDKIIAVSNFTREILVVKEHIKSNKVRVIYNGLEALSPDNEFNKINFLKSLNIRDSDTLFLCVSRIHREKNLETIISAMGRIDRKDIHLLIAGSINDSKYHEELVQSAKNEGLDGNIHFLGFRNDIFNLLNASELLIHSSLTESFGFVVAEAMQQKIPIIATDIPALREVATDKVATFFAPNNYIQLSDQILRCLSDKNTPKQTKKLQYGYERFQEKFSFNKMISEYEKVYSEL